jgi:hypothetical protein
MQLEQTKMPVNHLHLQAFTSIAPTPCRADRIRTCDPYVPNVVRYRAALLPEKLRVEPEKWETNIINISNSQHLNLRFNLSPHPFTTLV